MEFVKLVIVHYHLRPGGIRRIIELATPQLVRSAAPLITRVILATGQCADRSWHLQFEQQLAGVPVQVHLEPTFNYLSEQRRSPGQITARLRQSLAELFAGAEATNCLVWAHNPGVGRNLLLTRELAAACAAHDLPLIAHHHDWWFDNRWVRWPEMRRFGFRNLAAPARVVFPQKGRTVHVAINHEDVTILSRHFGKSARWLPNLTEPAPPPSAARTRSAQRWLHRRLAHNGEPVWLLPCRSLRRKNIAEALLLTRWLRPEAWLVVTGAASSADEAPYFKALETAAHRRHWHLRLGVLAGTEAGTPTVADLFAASEAVLLTSIQEGFGLPYLEAAAAQRPLIARRLPNIAPDLDRFGFRFPQAYDEILIAPELFNWLAERFRQQKRFNAWKAEMPRLAREQVSQPSMLKAAGPCAMPFSRLTLAAQLEVLTQPTCESWSACLPLNPFLKGWQSRAAQKKLQVTPWPRSAERWLSGPAYARNFMGAVKSQRNAGTTRFSPDQVQADFIAGKLDARNLYPLLWSQNA